MTNRHFAQFFVHKVTPSCALNAVGQSCLWRFWTVVKLIALAAEVYVTSTSPLSFEHVLSPGRFVQPKRVREGASTLRCPSSKLAALKATPNSKCIISAVGNCDVSQLQTTFWQVEENPAQFPSITVASNSNPLLRVSRNCTRASDR